MYSGATKVRYWRRASILTASIVSAAAKTAPYGCGIPTVDCTSRPTNPTAVKSATFMSPRILRLTFSLTVEIASVLLFIYVFMAVFLAGIMRSYVRVEATGKSSTGTWPVVV